MRWYKVTLRAGGHAKLTTGTYLQTIYQSCIYEYVFYLYDLNIKSEHRAIVVDDKLKIMTETHTLQQRWATVVCGTQGDG